MDGWVWEEYPVIDIMVMFNDQRDGVVGMMSDGLSLMVE